MLYFVMVKRYCECGRRAMAILPKNKKYSSHHKKVKQYRDHYLCNRCYQGINNEKRQEAGKPSRKVLSKAKRRAKGRDGREV